MGGWAVIVGILVVACAGEGDIAETRVVDGTGGMPRSDGGAFEGGGTGWGGTGGVAGSGNAGTAGAGAHGGVTGCGPGLALCNGVCTSLDSHPNCGGCGVLCTDSAVCENGSCRSPTCEEITCGLHIFDDPNRTLCSATGGCVECIEDADCAGAERTHCARGTCSECAVDADCDSGLRCAALRRLLDALECVDCVQDADCPDGTRCDSTHACVPTCTSAADCAGSTPACSVELGLCVICTIDADCPLTTPRCQVHQDPSRSRCVQCLEESDCALQLFTPHCAPSGTTCAQCALDEHCVDPNRPRCNRDGACVPCLEDADCSGATPWCDAMTHTCRESCTTRGCVEAGAIYGSCLDGDHCRCGTAHDCPDPARPRCDTFRGFCVAGTEDF